MWMGCLLGAMFLGLSILAAKLRVVPDPSGAKTVISQVGLGIFGHSALGNVAFYLLQAATMLILVLAANTSFADFPRLASFHAGDHFLPRQLTRYGDRLAVPAADRDGVLTRAYHPASLTILLVFRDANAEVLRDLTANFELSPTLHRLGQPGAIPAT